MTLAVLGTVVTALPTPSASVPVPLSRGDTSGDRSSSRGGGDSSGNGGKQHCGSGSSGSGGNLEEACSNSGKGKEAVAHLDHWSRSNQALSLQPDTYPLIPSYYKEEESV